MSSWGEGTVPAAISFREVEHVHQMRRQNMEDETIGDFVNSFIMQAMHQTGDVFAISPGRKLRRRLRRVERRITVPLLRCDT